MSTSMSCWTAQACTPRTGSVATTPSWLSNRSAAEVHNKCCCYRSARDLHIQLRFWLSTRSAAELFLCSVVKKALFAYAQYESDTAHTALDQEESKQIVCYTCTYQVHITYFHHFDVLHTIRLCYAVFVCLLYHMLIRLCGIQDETELEVFDNWEGQPGAAVTAGGQSSTRESK